MAVAARTQTRVTGKEIILGVDKAGSGGTYTLVGCAEDITIKGSKGSTEYSCRSGSGKLPSGDDTQTSISIKGLLMYYPTGEQAANMSAVDFWDWMDAGLIKNVKIFSEGIGDPIWTGPFIVDSFEISGPQSGNGGYSVELSSAAKVVRSTVASS